MDPLLNLPKEIASRLGIPWADRINNFQMRSFVMVDEVVRGRIFLSSDGSKPVNDNLMNYALPDAFRRAAPTASPSLSLIFRMQGSRMVRRRPSARVVANL
jgi:hypothetical protein